MLNSVPLVTCHSDIPLPGYRRGQELIISVLNQDIQMNQEPRYEALRYTCSHGNEYILIAPATELLPIDALDNSCDCRDGKPPGVKLFIIDSSDTNVAPEQNPNK